MTRPVTNQLLFSLAVALLGFTGCASLQLPRDQIEHFDTSVRSAKEMGALSLPTTKEHYGALGMPAAKAHLELAKDQAEVAKTMAAAGDSRAVLFLARAQSEADLAVGLARQAAMHSRALQATDDQKSAIASETR
jgi:hypothetical protein